MKSNSARSPAALKAYEPDRYYAALLATRHLRTDLLALVAFAAEMRRVAAEVSEPMIGEIRLQWWSDALKDSRCGANTGNPLADDFAAVARRHELPQLLIDGVIDASRARLYASAPEKPADIVPGLIAFEGGLFTLSGMILNGEDKKVLHDMVRPAAITYGLARLLHDMALRPRGAPFAPPLSETLLRDLHLVAQMQLKDARDAVAGLAGASKAAFLPLALVEPYLRLWNLKSDAAGRPNDATQLSQLRRMWSIWRSHLTGRI